MAHVVEGRAVALDCLGRLASRGGVTGVARGGWRDLRSSLRRRLEKGAGNQTML
jgi:hypothetical protein